MLINIHRIVNESWWLLRVGQYPDGPSGGFQVASRRRRCYLLGMGLAFALGGSAD
jgi:hypothetical protein